jgi:hypothetical protein
MSQKHDEDDDDSGDSNLWSDSPQKEKVDLKTCYVFNLPAVILEGQGSGWKCAHCGTTWKSRNQTKAAHHLAQLKGAYVSACTFSLRLPTPAEREAYKCRANEIIAGRDSRTSRDQAIYNQLTDRHDALVRTVDERKMRASPTLSLTGQSISSQPRASPTESSQRQPTGGWGIFERAGYTVHREGANPRMSPPTVLSNEAKKHDADTQLLAANMIHSCGLPFRFFEDQLVNQFLAHYKKTSSRYKHPSRNRIAGDLLRVNHETLIAAQEDKLLRDAEIFGIQLMGDGATVAGVPMINILASGVHARAVVLGVVDCSNQMAQGKGKT